MRIQEQLIKIHRMLACQCFHVLAQSLITYESWAFWSKKLLKNLSHSIATMGTNPTTSNFKFTPKHITFHLINIWHNYPFFFHMLFWLWWVVNQNNLRRKRYLRATVIGQTDNHDYPLNHQSCGHISVLHIQFGNVTDQ